ncbi:MAG: hypothetical protein E7319_08780 [Clostridiales bacterium]|nr:hypothetical protein [Clostridiales bacterium]
MQNNPQGPFQNMTPEQYQLWAQQNGMPPFGMQPPPVQPNDPFQWQPAPVQPPMQPPQMPQMPMWQQMPGQQQMTPEMMQQMQYEAFLWQQAQQMQQMQMQPQKVKKPKKPKQPKQPGGGRASAIMKIVLMLALIGGVIFFFASRNASRSQATATIQAATLGNTYYGDALIVRNETAYDEEGVQSIEYVAQEGSVVYRGDPLCYVYSTGYSTSEMTTLQDYRDQINDYQQTLLSAESAYDPRMELLEGDVVERGLEVRSLVQGARGNLTNQEIVLDTAITQRQNYFRSKYASDMRLSRLYDDENTQQQRIESWIKPKFAAQESIVSFYTDGFEYALSPTLYETYTPAQVRAMINGEKPQTSAADRGRIDLYRLIRKDNYAVLLLVKDKNWNPVNDQVYDLRLEQFTSTTVKAKVLSYARSGGELLVRLAVVDDVTKVLYMRTCEASIGEYVDCMMVPADAIYTQNGAKGVVIIQDGVQKFVPVTILNESGNEVYISAIQTGVLVEGMTVQLFD